ncbi:MAG: MoxR family ATPase [Bacteroidetes bacterium]|nr:MoxR family ATPase [Bacteroidota bacterium]MCL5026547.1 MoxR family ATPase [Chloroflexota bacterium]
MQEVQVISERLAANVEKVIVGKHETVELTLIALLCRGHLLIEDVPGVGKTVLAKSIAKSIGCTFKRIQFTPDLLPSDVTGVSVYNQRSGEFEFRPGPVMGQIVLVDEINRATPKTQSALLECMEEGQITVDGVTRPMPSPFLVLATQNPIEYEGTFPLPEAQLDRFLMRVSLGYPARDDEVEILGRQQVVHPIDELSQVAEIQDLLKAQATVRQIYVDKLLRDYVVSLVDATRHHPEVYLGASPRGSLALFRTGQARAAVQGRDFVTPDDIKTLALPTLGHRIIISASGRIRNVTPKDVIDDILRSVPVPGARVGA